MDHKIVGTTLPVLEMTLQPGEKIVSEAGELSWMTSSINLSTSTQLAGGGGIFGAFKRVVGRPPVVDRRLARRASSRIECRATAIRLAA